MAKLEKTELERVRREALLKHNNYRDKHKDTAQLKELEELNTRAQKWANRGEYKHDFKSGDGESLLWHPNKGYTEKQIANIAIGAVGAWYGEISDYDWKLAHPENFGDVGHFTALVWKTTTHVGMGVYYDENQVIVVARYSPAGNHGDFRSYVMPLEDNGGGENYKLLFNNKPELGSLESGEGNVGRYRFEAEPGNKYIISVSPTGGDKSASLSVNGKSGKEERGKVIFEKEPVDTAEPVKIEISNQIHKAMQYSVRFVKVPSKPRVIEVNGAPISGEVPLKVSYEFPANHSRTYLITAEPDGDMDIVLSSNGVESDNRSGPGKAESMKAWGGDGDKIPISVRRQSGSSNTFKLYVKDITPELEFESNEFGKEISSKSGNSHNLAGNFRVKFFGRIGYNYTVTYVIDNPNEQWARFYDPPYWQLPGAVCGARIGTSQCKISVAGAGKDIVLRIEQHSVGEWDVGYYDRPVPVTGTVKVDELKQDGAR